MAHAWPLLVLVAVSAHGILGAQSDYYGKYIGKLKTLHHGVTGEVFAVDGRTLHIRDFSYDGEGPAAYFYAGDSKSPNSFGFRVNDEKGTPNVLSRYRRKHITLTLPDNKTLRDIKWFSVWCDEFSVNFGDVRIPKNLDFPKPQKIDALAGVHLVSSDNIVVVDAQTLLIPGFSYDGEAPDAKFWVGRGSKPSPQGTRVPDENGKEEPLRRYDHKTIVLTLPGDTTVFDIGHFGVWCEAFTVDFGHIKVPRNLNVPPSLKMLGVSPQSKLNCEVLYPDRELEVRWAVAGDSVVIQLVSRLHDGEYMSFGLSGDNTTSAMDGSDVAVAWVNHTTLAGEAVDYYLKHKSQCSGRTGSCPDVKLQGKNNVRLLNAAMVNGYSIVTYQRPVQAKDSLDLPLWTSGEQPIVWAIGPLNSQQEVSYHHHMSNKETVLIEFSRMPKWNCPLPDSDNAASTQPPRGHSTRVTASTEVTSVVPTQTSVNARRTSQPQATPAPALTTNAWQIPAIQCYEPEDGVFYAQMGPTGGKRGYSAITGHVGWGISWYINGLLIPEINVVRGKTYNFVVEGGLDPEVPAKYHPFYITDDPVGGYEYKTPDERAKVHIFAGVRQTRRGQVYPTGTGRLCNWTPDPDQPPADEFASFGAYQRTLTLECDEGEAGLVQWTPDHNTPDTVYYQCYTHRYLGWKINVLDSCDTSSDASEPVPAQAASDLEHSAEEGHEEDEDEDVEGELQSRPSIRVTTRIKPSGIFFSGDKGNSEDIKNNILKGFQKFPSNTQENFQQDFPFSILSSAGSDENTKTADAEWNVSSLPFQQSNQQYAPTGQTQDTEVKAEQASPLLSVPKEQETFLIPENPLTDDNSTKIFKPSPPLILNPDAEVHSYLQPDSSNQQPIPVSTMEPISGTINDDAANRPIIENIQLQQESQSHAAVAEDGASTADPLTSTHSTTPLSVLSQNTEHHDVKLISSTPEPAELYESGKEKNTGGVSLELPEISDIKDTDVLKSNSETAPTIVNPPITAYKIPILHRPHGLAPHGYIMPSGRPATYPAHPQMMFLRPQGYSFRRPIPHRGYTHMHRTVAPNVFRHTYMPTPIPSSYVITSKKPFYRVTIMGNPHHRTMVSPPPFHRTMTTVPMLPNPARTSTLIPPQQQIASSYKHVHISLPPQLVKYDKIQSRISTTSTTTIEPEMKYSEDKMSDAVGKTSAASPAPLVSTSEESVKLNMPIAINTGFHPESVVVEGGFKPIIPKTIVAQDRSSVESETDNLSEEIATDLKALENAQKEITAELAKEKKDKEDRKENPFEGQQPELFEPMFIPSPPDRIVQQNGSTEKVGNTKPGALSADLVPPAAIINRRNSIQASRNPPQPFGMTRPSPTVIRRPVYANASPNFRAPARNGSPSFRYQPIAEESSDETPMAAERMDTYYLPPVGYNVDTQSNEQLTIPPDVEVNIPPGAVVIYDGKSVVDVSLASISDPSANTTSTFRNAPGTADLIRRTPQFGPFRGEVPPPVPNIVRPENIPQLQHQNKQRAQTLPLQLSQRTVLSNRPAVHSTPLTVVTDFNTRDDLLPAGSEIKELLAIAKGTKIKTSGAEEKYPSITPEGRDKKESSAETELLDAKLYDDSTKKTLSESHKFVTLKSEKRKLRLLREKRSAFPHHEPGHEGHDDHEGPHGHDHHDHHDMHVAMNNGTSKKGQDGNSNANPCTKLITINTFLFSLFVHMFL